MPCHIRAIFNPILALLQRRHFPSSAGEFIHSQQDQDLLVLLSFLLNNPLFFPRQQTFSIRYSNTTAALSTEFLRQTLLRQNLLTYAFNPSKCVTSRPTTSADVAVSSPSPRQVLSSAPSRWHTGESVLISSAVPSQRSRQRRDMALCASIVSRERTVRSRRRAARSKIEGEFLHQLSCARDVVGQTSEISAPASKLRLVSGC